MARGIGFLDGGSTTLFLARLLKQRTDITVVTNSVRAMEELADSGRLIFTGENSVGSADNGRTAEFGYSRKYKGR